MHSPRAATSFRLSILVAMVFVSLAISAVPSASADESASSLQGADVIVLPRSSFTPKQGTATREVLQGVPSNGTCEYTIAFHARDGDTAPQMASVIAIEPSSCKVEIERGVPSVIPGTESRAGTESDGGSDSAVVRGGSDRERGSRTQEDDVVAAADVGIEAGVDIEGVNRDKRATMWTIWQDPANVRVNFVRTSVRSHVENRRIQRASCTYRWEQLIETGWRHDGGFHNFDCTASSDRASSRDDEHFFNDAFLGQLCSARERTHVYYVRNTARVTLHDYFGFINDTWTTGGCSFLLSKTTFFEPGVYYRE